MDQIATQCAEATFDDFASRLEEFVGNRFDPFPR